MSARRPESFMVDSSSGAPIEEPGILFEVHARPDHTLPDAQGGLPAQPADPRAVEENERAVTNPPSLSPGVDTFGKDTEMLADPPDRVVDLAVLVRAEVEDIDLASRTRDREQHRIE